MNYLMLAASGENIVRQLVILVLVGICALIVWALGKWAITALKAPPHAQTAWNGLFILLAALVAINFLLSLIGYPILKL